MENGYQVTHSQLEHSPTCSGGGRKRQLSYNVVSAPVAGQVATISSARDKRKFLKKETGVDLDPAAVWRHTQGRVDQQLLQQIY